MDRLAGDVDTQAQRDLANAPRCFAIGVALFQRPQIKAGGDRVPRFCVLDGGRDNHAYPKYRSNRVIERTGKQMKSRSRHMRMYDLPGPHLLPGAIAPFMRSIGGPIIALAIVLDVLLFVTSRILGWPCISSICILAG